MNRDRHRDRDHWPRLFWSFAMMLVGIITILVLMYVSAPRPG